MGPSRRVFLKTLTGLGAFPVISGRAWAQTFPSRPVRIVVGFAPGGTSDILARLLGQWLSQRLSQAFVVENRPGAGTNLATEMVTKAAPDGYTLLLFSSSAFTNATLYDRLNFNFIRDIAPVASIARGPLVMLINPSMAAKSVTDVISYANANPGKINVASAGNGTLSHVSSELFKMLAGIRMVHVPYRGDAPALTDLIGGQVQVYFGTLSASIEYIRSGQVRALGITTATRSKALPDVPSLSEFVPGFEASLWNGLGAPSGTPAAIINKLNDAINTALVDPGITTQLANLGATASASTHADFGKVIAEETEKWGKVIRAANIKLE